MTQEDKELLLKDLCARSFYSVKVTVPIMSFIKGQDPYTEPIELISVNAVDMTCTVGDWYAQTSGVRMFNRKGELVCKPYLRPMSSMIKEEKAELNAITNEFGDNWFEATTPEERWKCTFLNSSNQIDWLNAHHFDYRNLIGLGLALEATADMYNLKK